MSLQLQFLKYWKTIQEAFLTKTAEKDRKHKGLMFCKVDNLESFVKFTGKRLCQRLFSKKVAG